MEQAIRRLPSGGYERQRSDGTWVGTYRTEAEAMVNLVHDRLYEAQRQGDAVAYHRWLGRAWEMPLPMHWLNRWEEFRPRPRPVTPQIPDVWRAPKRALAWGVDPRLVAQAPLRHRIVRDLTPHVDRWRNDPRNLVAMELLVSAIGRACQVIRQAGWAAQFGLKP